MVDASSPTTKSSDDHVARMGRRAGVAFMLVVALWFVASSTYQITAQLFEIGGTPGTAPLPACKMGIQSLERALDDASSQATREGDQTAIEKSFEAGLLPTWNEAPVVQKTCSQTSAGSDAYDALLKLRRAHEAVLRHQIDVVKPLRESLDARLDPH